MQGEQRAPIFENVKLLEYTALGKRRADNYFNKADNFFNLLLKNASKTRQEAGNDQSTKKTPPPWIGLHAHAGKTWQPGRGKNWWYHVTKQWDREPIKALEKKPKTF